jgi:hypothetical protein
MMRTLGRAPESTLAMSSEVDPHLDARLDEALKETFPASDPPAVSLSDDPPKVSRFPEDHPPALPEAPTHRSLIQRVLTGSALAVAGVVVTRMILRRKRPRTLH